MEMTDNANTFELDSNVHARLFINHIHLSSQSISSNERSENRYTLQFQDRSALHELLFCRVHVSGVIVGYKDYIIDGLKSRMVLIDDGTATIPFSLTQDKENSWCKDQIIEEMTMRLSISESEHDDNLGNIVNILGYIQSFDGMDIASNKWISCYQLEIIQDPMYEAVSVFELMNIYSRYFPNHPKYNPALNKKDTSIRGWPISSIGEFLETQILQVSQARQKQDTGNVLADIYECSTPNRDSQRKGAATNILASEPSPYYPSPSRSRLSRRQNVNKSANYIRPMPHELQSSPTRQIKRIQNLTTMDESEIQGISAIQDDVYIDEDQLFDALDGIDEPPSETPAAREYLYKHPQGVNYDNFISFLTTICNDPVDAIEELLLSAIIYKSNGLYFLV